MTLKESTFQVGLRVAVIMLVGALSIGPLFAEDGGAGVRDGEGSHLSAPVDGTQPPSADGSTGAGVKLGDPASADTKNDNGKGVSGEGARNGANDPTGEAHPSVQGADSNDTIDTSISVQPRRPSGGRDKLSDGKHKTSALFGAGLHSRRFFAPGASHRFARNAIGARVARHEGSEQDFGRRNFWGGMHGVAPGTIDPAEHAGGHWPEDRLDRPTPNTSPIVKPPILNDTAINGSTLKRPGVGPAKIGGANAAIAGINGTSIRQKH